MEEGLKAEREREHKKVLPAQNGKTYKLGFFQIFESWADIHLVKELGKSTDLSTSFRDGVALCVLVQVLSKHVVNYVPDPKHKYASVRRTRSPTIPPLLST